MGGESYHRTKPLWELRPLDPGLIKAMEVFGFTSRAELTAQNVRTKFRELAKKAHPDLGGTEDAMKRLNLAHQVLVLNLTPEEPTA